MGYTYPPGQQMTSIVTVTAICQDDKEVKVVVLDDGIVETEDHLQNGEEGVYYIHDMVEIYIKEPYKE